MAWVVGIDEAGYGPNLGPFVMTAVACRIDDAGADIWARLAAAVRRDGDEEDERLLVADSKVVYSTGRGLLGLERGVHAALPCCDDAATLGELIAGLEGDADGRLRDEPWYREDSALPTTATADELGSARDRFGKACAEAGVGPWLACGVVVATPRFNALLGEGLSKGVVLAHALGELLRRTHESTADGEPAVYFVDKHGGRNTYAAFIQHALSDGVVLARQESMARSVYEVHGLGREMRLTFQPRADSEHFCVALASMASKYVRELCMREFNGFWQGQVPGLKATAGYPGDAVRFYEAIRGAAGKLGVKQEAIWRWK